MKIAIIGGGITGLTTGLALQKLGIESAIYEQAPALNEVGAGVWLQPNAIQVLDWLGLRDEVLKAGFEFDKMEITNSQLIPFKKINESTVQDAYGNKTIAIHRGRLQKLLYDAYTQSCTVHLGKKYMTHKEDQDGIQIQFEDGMVHSDVLLGADGIHSNVRKSMFPSSSLRNSGQICWRGVSRMDLPDSLRHSGKEAWGKQVRFGFSQIRDGETYWFAVANEDHYTDRQRPAVPKYLHDIFSNFSPVVNELVAHTEPTKIHQAILQDLKRLPTWHAGNACLVGDAAHATTPNMGQGACQGIEDAYHISHVIAQASIERMESTFLQFQKSRRQKVDYVVNNSWMFGKMAHSKLGQPLMKLIFKLTPEKMVKSQLSKLYALK